MKALPTWSHYGRFRNCGICMENKPVSDSMFINGCSHSYCSKCIGRYVTEKIRNNEGAIRCPHPGCRVGTLTPEICKPVLARELLDQWLNLLMKHQVPCGRRYCLACKDVWRLRQEDLLFVELANKMGWNRCPFCRIYVEKLSGCPNITCRCGQSFKYI